MKPMAALAFWLGWCAAVWGAEWSGGTLWIEGEGATRSQVTPHAWYDSVLVDKLSGKAWASHFDEQRDGMLEFDFAVPATAEYTFWLRANPTAAKLAYRLTDRDWREVDFSGDVRGTLNLATDGKPDLRFVAWIKVGSFKLDAGPQTLSLRMHSDAQHHGAVDCLALSSTGFVPSGATRPGEHAEQARPDEWFAVIADDDPLDPSSVIDMSALIEAPAGKFGFLRRREDCLEFEQGEGPVKLWGVGAPPLGDSPAGMERAAKWLRKHGVNLVRQHTVIDAVGLLDVEGRFDPQRLDRYDRWFAALKAEGIYTAWSVVYPHHGAFLQRGDVPEQLFDALDRADSARDGRRGPIVANDYINLDQRIQDAAWRYFEALLSHRNPYTQLAYCDDPALAILEIQNESNVFFFTLNTLLTGEQMPELAKEMRRRFWKFANDKYGDERAAVQAWDGLSSGDDWKKGELALMGAHHFGAEGPLYEFQGKTRRCGDYIEFLAEVQRTYYKRRVQQMREAGFRGVTVATAWRAGGPAASLANLYCDAAADCIDRHNYFGGGDGGHRIAPGAVNRDTHLDQPGRGLLSVGMFQAAHRPFAYSEWSQMPPNPWKAEAAPLIAFYGMGLQGWDMSCHFALGGPRLGEGWPNESKYATQTPHYLGQFPALAFAIHNRHFSEGDVVALRKVGASDVFSGRDALGQALAGGGHDAKTLVGRLATPPEALAVGRVLIEFGEGPSESASLEKAIDQTRRVIFANTGELIWRYGERRI
ncbi:MAG: hypothetical protein KDA61_02920 [Planctomycetales bacterium]|nr:hypothetical protein [Planctomycetales bacterium]